MTEFEKSVKYHQESVDKSLAISPQESLSAMARIRFPDTQISPVVRQVEENQASEFHKRLVIWINEFNNSLDEANEVGVRLVSFGQTVVFHLEDLGHWNPSLISFRGVTADGEPVELIQHVSQISILLMKLPRRNPDHSRTQFGFHAMREDQTLPQSS